MPVSGPGKFSQRTDRQPIAQLNNADYGEQKAYKQLQQDAPMASAPGMPGTPDLSQMFSGAAANVVPMGQPSGQPGVPVTNGADAGPGVGMDALGLQSPDQQAAAQTAAYMPAYMFLANKPGSSSTARNLIRRIRSNS